MDRERAGVGVDGLSGRRDAAADGGGGQLGRQRRRAASSRASCARSIATTAATPSQPKVVRRTISADTAATLTDDHGRRRRRDGTAQGARRFPATRSPARPARRTKLVERPLLARPTTTRRSSASCRRAIRRSRSSSSSTRRTAERRSPAARSSAPIFKRIAEATLRYLGVAADDQPGAAGARRARTTRRRDRAGVADGAREPVVSLVADEPPGTVPDLRGLSAREAIRKLVKLGLTARMSGDGFVVSQDPPPGTPLDARRVCRLMLERSPVAAARDATPAMTWAELHGVLRGRGLIRADDGAARRAGGRRRHRRRLRLARGRHRARCSSRSRAQHADGAAFARQAIERGAPAIVSEQPAPAGVRVPWAMVDDARLALARARGGVLSPSQRRDAGGRHHRHQRQDDDGVSDRRRSSKRRGIRCGILGTVALPHRRRSARGDAHDAGSAGGAGPAARDGRPRAAAPARWKCRRTRCRCGASTA